MKTKFGCTFFFGAVMILTCNYTQWQTNLNKKPGNNIVQLSSLKGQARKYKLHSAVTLLVNHGSCSKGPHRSHGKEEPFTRNEPPSRPVAYKTSKPSYSQQDFMLLPKLEEPNYFNSVPLLFSSKSLFDQLGKKQNLTQSISSWTFKPCCKKTTFCF